MFDVITEYCRASVRLRTLRAALPTITHEIYRVEAGRHGAQVKTHPYVAQINETFRHWRTLAVMLSLSPADERNLALGIGDPFDQTEQYFG